MSRIDRLIAHWSSHGIEHRPGVDPALITEFEKLHSVVLPNDMREYFLAVNGTGGMGEIYDDNFFSFWRIEDLVSVDEEHSDRTAKFPEVKSYFIFADHSINLPGFAIRLSDDPTMATPVASIYTDSGAFAIGDIFGSFGEFLDSYLNDWMDVIILPDHVDLDS